VAIRVRHAENPGEQVDEFLPYGRQSISDDDVLALATALRDPLITQGPRVEEFERAFAAVLGAGHAVAFANGTAGLHGAMFAAGIGAGDLVLTTPISFVASCNCALYVGARPLFADIDPDTANLDLPSAVRSGRAGRARACLAVSLAGLPIDLSPLQELRERGMVLIEDGCHALGATRDGIPVGGDGRADMTVFSLHPVKAITAGEGGVVVTHSEDLAERLRRFRTHGIERREDASDPLVGAWHYDIDTLGFNYRITDLQCALGLSQLRRLATFIAERNRVAQCYRERLGELEGIIAPSEPAAGDRHAYHLFVVRFPEGAVRRRQAFEHMRAAGIGCQLHYIPIYRHGLYRSLGFDGEAARCPEAEAYYAQALSLPIFPAMSARDVQRVVDELARALAVPLPRASAEGKLAPGPS
jgi:UDP-4-amino-4,6-dideoxy-N-acetyl-beta-L-altrosamine transaminase